MTISENQILEALRGIIDTDGQASIANSGRIGGISIQDGRIGLALQLRSREEAGQYEGIRQACEAAIRALPGVESARVVLTLDAPGSTARTPSQWDRTPVTNVRHLVAVASGKGGVGKSTTTVNLALSLKAAGQRVGILDADIYGPSIPRMLGLSKAGQPEVEDDLMLPWTGHGIPCMSMGFIAGEENAVVWRGSMVTKALRQMVRMVRWPELDILLIDLPPGTGDVTLSLAQAAPLTGALVVTTPQDVATLDAAKSLQMFAKMDVPVLGIIENMSAFVDPASGQRIAIFGEGGGQRLANEYKVPLLGSIPLEAPLRVCGDAGTAFMDGTPDSEAASQYHQLARSVISSLGKRAAA